MFGLHCNIFIDGFFDKNRADDFETCRTNSNDLVVLLFRHLVLDLNVGIRFMVDKAPYHLPDLCTSHCIDELLQSASKKYSHGLHHKGSQRTLELLGWNYPFWMERYVYHISLHTRIYIYIYIITPPPIHRISILGRISRGPKRIRLHIQNHSSYASYSLDVFLVAYPFGFHGTLR